MAVSPCHLSGSGRRALDSSHSPVTSTDSSPRRLVMASPSAPIQSPRSKLASTSLGLHRTASTACMSSCTEPVTSWRVAKESLPWPRMLVSRPAIRTISPVRTSGVQVAVAAVQLGGGGRAVEAAADRDRCPARPGPRASSDARRSARRGSERRLVIAAPTRTPVSRSSSLVPRVFPGCWSRPGPDRAGYLRQRRP